MNKVKGEANRILGRESGNIRELKLMDLKQS